jgi:hypothetical protein
MTYPFQMQNRAIESNTHYSPVSKTYRELLLYATGPAIQQYSTFSPACIEGSNPSCRVAICHYENVLYTVPYIDY